jgi:hypothetical protein
MSGVYRLGPLGEELHGFLAGLSGALASASVPAPGLCAVTRPDDRGPGAL